MESLRSLIAASFESGAIVVNVSYVLLIASMLMSKISYLRILAIGSGLTGVIYFWVFLGDRIASLWEVLFIAANLFQLALTAYRDRMSRFDPDETLFRNSAVPGLSPSDARRLLKAATVVELSPGTVLLREGEEVRVLAFILSGDVVIMVAGREVARLGHGDFVGEIGVMSGGPATATVVAATPVRHFAFEAAALRHLLKRHHVIGQELELAFRQGLREKLVRANAALASHAAVA